MLPLDEELELLLELLDPPVLPPPPPPQEVMIKVDKMSVRFRMQRNLAILRRFLVIVLY